MKQYKLHLNKRQKINWKLKNILHSLLYQFNEIITKISASLFNRHRHIFLICIWKTKQTLEYLKQLLQRRIQWKGSLYLISGCINYPRSSRQLSIRTEIDTRINWTDRSTKRALYKFGQLFFNKGTKTIQRKRHNHFNK